MTNKASIKKEKKLKNLSTAVLRNNNGFKNNGNLVKSPSYSRTQARELDKKFVNATKSLSSYLHNTGEVTNDFQGYKLHAGTFTDRMGRTWQVQAHAVLAKKNFIKRDEIIPIIRKWAIGVRARAFIKYVIDEIFS